ncbi:cupin [Helicobacter sp. 12S02634-8]|uniref:cupin domain-containing protein n=1 Tax=Helicobacter sp. 12S02634-8 TaxID=1476199 RepID=UPI000BA7E2BD|nr:cupin domain-containing protein [Helicobacter sp. 12S02634-8]PAF48158.1 cupin [Helicobacter sp. 12S02634-8]
MEKIIFTTETFEGVKPTLLCETDFTKEIRITMAKGAVMKEHSAPAPIIVQVLEGEITFEVNGEAIKMGRLDLVSLKPNVPHSLTALSNAIVRLSLHKSDHQNRVIDAAKR